MSEVLGSKETEGLISPLFEEYFNLLKLKESFLYPTVRYVLEETPKHFSHDVEVMAAYREAKAAFEDLVFEDSFTFGIMAREVLLDKSINITDKGYKNNIYFLISKSLQPELEKLSIELAKLALTKEDLDSLDNLQRKFINRDDLIKPAPNCQRIFPVLVNGQEFEAIFVSERSFEKAINANLVRQEVAF